jgi:N-acetylmuramoyl-L-alanine amidase
MDGRWLRRVAVVVLSVGMAAPWAPSKAAASPTSVRTAPATIATLAYGDAVSYGSMLGASLSRPIVGMASTRSSHGYWYVAADGGIFAFGDAVFYGSMGGIPLNQPIVGMAATPSGNGYWLVAADGGIFAFGDAGFFGSTGATRLNQPIVGLAATPSGRGYWLVASDGGMFAFGDAGFFGSMGGTPLSRPVVAMAASHSGRGYWLVAGDGGIFAFGDAGFLGGLGAIQLSQPIVGMAATAAAGGYWLVARDGGVFAFGNAVFYGSAAGQPVTPPVIGMVATGDGGGYWLAQGARSIAGKVIVLDPGHNGANGANPQIINQPVNIITGIKACDTAGTTTLSGYPEHAYNFDVATRAAAILQTQGATVILTRPNDNGVGPCIDQRAAIANLAHADAAVSIHADGGPPGGRGFHVILPAVIPGHNDAIVPASDALGLDLRNDYLNISAMPLSNYIGNQGFDTRSDLGGLNLSTVPKVFIETGNMQNGTDAALLESPGFRDQAAHGIAQGIIDFLSGN